MSPALAPQRRGIDLRDVEVSASTGMDRRYFLGRGTRYSPRVQQLLPHSAYLVAVKAASKAGNVGCSEDLVLYRAASGRFVLAVWVVRPGESQGPGLLQSVEIMDRHPDHAHADGWMPPRLDYIVLQLRPAYEQAKAAHRRLIDQDIETKLGMEETQAQRHDLIKHLYKHESTKAVARDFESGMMPFASDREMQGSGNKLADALLDQTISANRVISSGPKGRHRALRRPQR